MSNTDPSGCCPARLTNQSFSIWTRCEWDWTINYLTNWTFKGTHSYWKWLEPAEPTTILCCWKKHISLAGKSHFIGLLVRSSPNYSNMLYTTQHNVRVSLRLFSWTCCSEGNLHVIYTVHTNWTVDLWGNTLHHQVPFTWFCSPWVRMCEQSFRPQGWQWIVFTYHAAVYLNTSLESIF